MTRLFRAGIHYYISGLIILTLGIAFAIISMLGTSPFDALLVGLYRTFGLTIGSWEVVVGLTMVIGNAIAEKKRPEYFALITSLITGIGIDSWLYFLQMWITPNSLATQWICLIISLILTGLGIAIYIHSHIAPNPMDRSMLIVAKRTGWNLTYSRATINVLLVIVAFLFGGAIGIGTLVNAIFSGIFIHYFSIYITKMRENGLKKFPKEKYET